MNYPDDSILKTPTQTPTFRDGCYLVRYTPIQFPEWPIAGHYDGTLRVDHLDGSLAFSGDLYVHLPPTGEDTGEWPFNEPYPAYYSGIPTFPLSEYSYYLRGISADESSVECGSMELRFELYRYFSAASEARFRNQGFHTVVLKRSPAPPLYTSKTDFWAGPVCDCSGAIVGLLTAGWITPHLREITVEMDKVQGADYPLDNAADITWQTVFDTLAIRVTVQQSQDNIPEPSDESWSDAELHAAMLENRDESNLNRYWYYYLMCVRRLDTTERGLMFDRGAVDSNKVPREGSAIATDWEIPDEGVWGTVRGMRFGSATSVYFRTALHEIGHALGLAHNGGSYIMTPTESIAFRAGSMHLRFPENILWTFAPDDARRLRHFPDPVMRPGGEEFGQLYNTPLIALDESPRNPPGKNFARARGFTLAVDMLMEAVPFGAPVRVHATLANATKQELAGPANLKFRSGGVRGRVTDSGGTVRSFCSLVLTPDESAPVIFQPAAAVEEFFALMRGAEGALFPHPGEYLVEIDVCWEIDNRSLGLTGSAKIVISPPEDASQLEVATRLIQSPDAFLTFVLAGDYLPEGVKLIEAALQHPVLRPHFAMAAARRIGRAFRRRPADIPAAAAILDDQAILGPSEIRRAAELLGKAKPGKDKTINRALDQLKNKAARLKVGRQAVQPLFDE